MSSARVGNQFLEEHSCRCWGVRGAFRLFSKGKHISKGRQNGKGKYHMLAGFPAHARQSEWREWMEGRILQEKEILKKADGTSNKLVSNKQHRCII